MELYSSIEELERAVSLKNKILLGLIINTYFFQKLNMPYGSFLYLKGAVSFLTGRFVIIADGKESW